MLDSLMDCTIGVKSRCISSRYVLISKEQDAFAQTVCNSRDPGKN